MQLLFKSSSFTIYQKGEQVYFKEQVAIGLYLGVGGLILGGLFYSLPYLIDSRYAEMLFTKWISIIIIGSSVLVLLKSVIQALKKPFRIDLNKKVLYRKSRTIAFTGSERLVVKHHDLVNTPYVRIELETGQASYYLSPLLPEKVEGELKRIIQPINENLVTTADILFEERPSNVSNYFLVWFTCLFGTIWSATAWYFIPNLIFTSRGSDSGLLVWPFGIWVIALGIIHRLGVPVLQKNFMALSIKGKLVMAGWVVSYLVLCHV